MNKWKWFFFVGALSMGVSIVYGLTIGDFWGEGSVLLGLLWGKITMLDIYLAFLTFSGWMFWREGGVNVRSVVLFVGILVLGSFTICAYTFWAMHTARGDWMKFWQGRRYAV
ncbi:MAG: hypothetical protein ACRC5C_15035 [Bacilli bacterium]